VRTRLALIILLLLSFTGALLGDAVDVRDNQNAVSENNTFDADDLDPYVAHSESRVIRNPPRSVELSSKMPLDARSRPQHALMVGRLNRAFGFARQNLHTLQMVFRI
jgi:hypothetical protein